MRQELDNLLCQRYPEIFADRHADSTASGMGWGFCCGDYWFDLIFLKTDNRHPVVDWQALQCFGLSDEGIEYALYDSQAIRSFVGIDLNLESAPDAMALLKFRRLFEEHKLTERIFAAINVHLADKGLMLKEGTVVDATIIAAPSSTKNAMK